MTWRPSPIGRIVAYVEYQVSASSFLPTISDMNQSSTANVPRIKVMDPQDRFTKLDDRVLKQCEGAD